MTCLLPPPRRRVRFSGLAAVTLVLVMAGCGAVQVPKAIKIRSTAETLPAMRWDHRPEAAEWTTRSLAAVARHDAILAGQVPRDIDGWCPGYADKTIEERRAFWVAVLSAVAKHESTWNPRAVGGRGRWVGLMQISPRTAAHHQCSATTVAGLKNGGANLECAVEIMAEQVARDGVVSGSGGEGIGRDWMPLRKSEDRAEMAAWIGSQSYCQQQAR